VLLAASVLIGLAVGLIVRGHPTSPIVAASGTGTGTTSGGANAVAVDIPPVAARPLTPAQLAALPQATTWGVTPAAPHDPDPRAVPTGELVSPHTTVAVYAAPGGPPVAALPAHQLDGNHQPVGPTAAPVIATTPGWAEILLPTKPNGSVGWVSTDSATISLSTSPDLIEVDRAHYTLTLLRHGVRVDRWTVADGILMPRNGSTQSVTPAGRTFVLADIQIVHPTYSPVIMPLGTHSPIWDTYGGGPATVGIHTWTPDPSVYGEPASHGCIRVPAPALQVLSTTVPIGTPVLIK
jgi:lipoprotein-anchoring transpeptidase ErfK/SrfK